MIQLLDPIRANVEEAWERVVRGWRRTFRTRPASTVGQYAQAEETEVSLGLMAAAAASGPAMSPEQQIFLSQSEHGMRERLSVLLRIPHRSLAQEREKIAIEQWLSPPPLVHREQPAPAMGLLGSGLAIASGLRFWHVLAAGLALTTFASAVQTARLNNAKHDLAETREDLALAMEQREAWKQRSEAYAQAVADARQVATQTAAALEAERARRARAAAVERRRQREIQSVIAGSPEPPAWSLRDDTEIPDGPSAPN